MAKEGLGFEITELRLGLPGCEHDVVDKNDKKRVFSEIAGGEDQNSCTGHWKMQTKMNQVVGWPPVCSYRKKNSLNEASKMYVKISMDGAPFLRKIDLGMHKGYSELAMAMEKLFGCYGISEFFFNINSIIFQFLFKSCYFLRSFRAKICIYG